MTKKDLILKEALSLFITYGFNATPTSKIAEKAKVSNGTLFYYFPTKEDLFKQLYLNIKNSLHNRLIKSVTEKMTTRQKIKDIWLNYAGWGIENPEYFLFWEQFYKLPAKNCCTDLSQNNNDYFDFISEIIKIGIKEESLQNIEVNLILNFFNASVSAILHYKCKNKLKVEPEYLEQAFLMFWRGIVNI